MTVSPDLIVKAGGAPASKYPQFVVEGVAGELLSI